MLKPIRKLVKFTSSSKGAIITLVGWILAVIILSVLAPSANDYEGNSTEGSVNQDRPSAIAEQLEEDVSPTDEGLTALLVLPRDNKINEEDREAITELSDWLAS